MAVCCCLVAACSCLFLSAAVCSCLFLSVAVCGGLWPAVAVCGRLWPAAALLHEWGDDRGSANPGRTYPAACLTGMPRAAKPFRSERVNATGPTESANDRNLEFSHLTVDVPRHEALARQFHRSRIMVSTRLWRWQRSGPRPYRWRPGLSPSSPERTAAVCSLVQTVAAGPVSVIALAPPTCLPSKACRLVGGVQRNWDQVRSHPGWCWSHQQSLRGPGLARCRCEPSSPGTTPAGR